MTSLHFTNALAVLACAWAVWARRLSFRSRWDAPLTVGVALYAVASALDAPWPAIAAASFPLSGKFYLFNTVGQICFLAGNAWGVRAVCLRLLPDDELDRFMKTRIVPTVAIAATVMVACAIASPVTSTMPADYLYGVRLDGWLRVYFSTFFLTMAATLWMALFGIFRLGTRPPGPGAALHLMGTVSIGSLACLGFLAALLTDRSELIPRIWPVAYLTTTAAALSCAFTWRRRIAALTEPANEP